MRVFDTHVICIENLFMFLLDTKEPEIGHHRINMILLMVYINCINGHHKADWHQIDMPS